ncbi:unnamed protein product [Alopecurus aequalis]
MSSAAARLATAADNASAEAQSLIDMRKALNSMKSLAVDYERDGKPDKVKRVEEEVLELMASYEDCAHLAEAVKGVPGAYQPSEQTTDFRKLIEAEVNKVKGPTSQASGHSQQLLRQFREAVWGVHHAGQPMPGDEQEDLVMTSTQGNILNFQCPLTMKPIVELTDPVRCIECRHIYDRDPIIRHIRLSKAPKCPVAGCPRVLSAAKLVCDAYLRMDLDELRASGPGASNAADVEDIEDDDEDLMDGGEDGNNE